MEVVFGEKHYTTGVVEFKASPGWLQDPEEIDEINRRRALRVTLGLGNFPYQLLMSRNVKKPVPAVDFANSVASVGGLFNQEQNIYVTPTEYFTTKYREIFTNAKNQAYDRERGKGVAGRAKHEILAAAAEYLRYGGPPLVLVFQRTFC